MKFFIKLFYHLFLSTDCDDCFFFLFEIKMKTRQISINRFFYSCSFFFFFFLLLVKKKKVCIYIPNFPGLFLRVSNCTLKPSLSTPSNKCKKINKNKNYIRANPSNCPPLPNCPPPLISPKAKKILEFFLVKDLFFSIGKKGKGANCPPPYFREKCSEGGGGQLGGFALMAF